MGFNKYNGFGLLDPTGSPKSVSKHMGGECHQLDKQQIGRLPSGMMNYEFVSDGITNMVTQTNPISMFSFICGGKGLIV